MQAAGAAILALTAAVACSKSVSTPTPVQSASPTPVPVPTGQTPAPSAAGVAFVPDGGNGGQPGVNAIHFLANTGLPFAYPQQMVAFPRSVRSIGISPDGSSALAAEGSPGAYQYLQAFLGATFGNIVPGGPAYNAGSPPPTPSPAPSTSATPTAPPSDAFIPDVTSVVAFGNGIEGIGLSLGPAAGGNTSPPGLNGGILGVNQLFDQNPTFAGYIPFGGAPSPAPSIPPNARANLAVGKVSFSSGKFAVLARGPSDLVALTLTPQANGTVFFIQPTAYDGAKLGTNNALIQGRGAMAFSPIDGGRAVIAQASNSATQVALVTGLPSAITVGTPVAPPPPITLATSVDVSPNGIFTAIGADSGLYVYKGVAAGTLTFITQGASKGPFSPPYYAADGTKHPLQNVSSVGFTADGNYLVALGSTAARSPGGGAAASVVVMPFNSTTGLVAAPVIVDNLTAFGGPAYNQDFMVVR